MNFKDVLFGKGPLAEGVQEAGFESLEDVIGNAVKKRSRRIRVSPGCHEKTTVHKVPGRRTRNGGGRGPNHQKNRQKARG